MVKVLGALIKTLKTQGKGVLMEHCTDSCSPDQLHDLGFRVATCQAWKTLEIEMIVVTKYALKI